MKAANDATQRQIDAANPQVSTWLSANAGSGKTRVLTDRVARLLLQGVSPQKILCLTYTKAAASEMQNRLFRRLGEWAMTNDVDLRNQLTDLGVAESHTAQELARARTLFASALETPGGLKIQTIHSFCSSLLRRFPLEAGVSPFFREIEERASDMLRDEVLDALSQGQNANAVAELARHLGGEDISRLTSEIVKNREGLQENWTKKNIWASLNMRPDFDEQALLEDVFLGGELDHLSRLADILSESSALDQKASIKLGAIGSGSPGLQTLDILIDVMLVTKTGVAKIGKFPTKAVRQENPELMAVIEPLMLRVESAAIARNQLMAAQRTLAFRRFATQFLDSYAAEKLSRGWLDFDDLILKAKNLLTDPAVAQWVLYRLDGGIDHILVDEAQDTSPLQWHVVELLAQEFTAGLGTRSEEERTIFVVGDLKQSIYSFQGADPDAFGQMKEHFQTQLTGTGRTLFEQSLDYSFRSSPAILRTVDATFEAAGFKGLSGSARHLAFHENMPGRVDVWPLVPVAETPAEKEWFDPTDKVAENDHRVILARQIADEIKRMITAESLPADDGTFRRVNAGDVLILVQRRSLLFHEIIRACKALNLPIAGADRLRIGGELAVKDISALLAFLANADDDLALASALRSPLFGWSENQLYDLAHNRNENRLWPALFRRREEFPETYRILNHLRQISDFQSPYELVEKILTTHNGRQRLLARLGPEAEDGIDALVSQALAYERSETPSLTGFIVWLESDEVEIKRQHDSAGNRIRVMTTHGAKGLEAPIVFLPDTAHRAVTIRDQIVPIGDNEFLWKSPSGHKPDVEQESNTKQRTALEEERMRLLYVAMTRAEKWLVVCGSGKTKEDSESWHDLVAAGIEAAGAEKLTHPTGIIQRHQHGIWKNAETEGNGARNDDEIALPAWAKQNVPTPTSSPPPVSPSDMGGEKFIFGDPSAEGEFGGTDRGTFIHLLLEHLPKSARSEWDRIAAEILMNCQLDQGAIRAEAYRVLENPDLSHLFAPEALAEVDISASLPEIQGQRIHGTIDRLIVHDRTVLCVDFKSNAVVPEDPELVPSGLLRQMGAYASALAQIFPEHEIRSAILWTRSATLMQIPHDIVIDALHSTATS